MAKVVTKGGKTSKTYFLYDGGSVTMEADEKGVTAKNTYGGPLLLRTVFGEEETIYQYLYNAHGDVVTLLANGEVAATYYYDSFGNVLEQTGNVDNSILYAGYQYDEETGLYYINARMYDPVTARFLQADTYLGSLNDPLSLNLYTYCLNNPHKYTDPSGHIAITTVALLLFAAGMGVWSGKQEFDRQVAEGDNYTNWVSIGVVGISNTLLCLIPGGKAVSAYKAATIGGSFAFKTFAVQFGKAVGIGIASGYATDAGIEVARQLATGTKLSNLEYDRINEAGVTGAIAGGAGAIFGAGVEALANTRVVKAVVGKIGGAVSKGKNAIKNGFAKVAGKSGKISTQALTGLDEPMLKLDLQFFAGDEAYRGGSKARRLQEVIVNNAPEKGDVINIRNIYNELNKSEVGRETLDYLMRNDDITVNFHYHIHPNEDGLLGRIVDRNIDIYVPAHPTNTKVNVTKTLIHETTHAFIDSLRNTRKEEVICFIREVLHDNNGITSRQIKEIIQEVNSLYAELPWR